MCRSRERDSFNICMYDVYVQLLYANEAALRDVGVAWRTESAPREAYDLHILKFACQQQQQQQHRRGTLKAEEKLVGRGRGERGCGCSWLAAVGQKQGLWHLKQTHVFQIYTRIRLATNIIKRTAGEASPCYSCFAYFCLSSFFFPLLLLPLFALLLTYLSVLLPTPAAEICILPCPANCLICWQKYEKPWRWLDRGLINHRTQIDLRIAYRCEGVAQGGCT